jgi:hypothetical protein
MVKKIGETKGDNLQIKSRIRVRDAGEVFTELREVNNILDLTEDAHSNYKSQRILEPACGNGNFLIRILQRRIEGIKRSIRKSNQDLFEFHVLTALSTMYGIDIMSDNIIECRNRLLYEIKKTYDKRVSKKNHRKEFFRAVENILKTNIILGDFLNKQEKVVFTEYSAVKDGYFKINKFLLKDLVNGKNEPISSEPVVHYLNLEGESGRSNVPIAI